MGLFGKKKERTSVVLIDIDASTVGAALSYIAQGEQPTLYYTARENIEPLEHEESSDAMIRVLSEVAHELTTKGAPLLRKETGSGHIDRIIVTIGAPWQQTSVRSEVVTQTKPFLFTKTLLAESTQKHAEVPEGFQVSGESVITTLLNGYEMPQPFGKKATRAEFVILSSLLDSHISKKVEDVLRKTYHTHALTMTAFASTAYTVFRDIYPHEKDFLVLQVSGKSTDALSIKHGVLTNAASIPHGIQELIDSSIENARVVESKNPLIDPARNARFSARMDDAEKTWLTTIQKMLQEFAVANALPRTVFLLASVDAHNYLKRLLDTPDMRTLWLTSDAVRIIPVVASHFASFVQLRGEAKGDVSLELLALGASKIL